MVKTPGAKRGVTDEERVLLRTKNTLKRAEFEVITPAEAKELLANNRVNRKLRPGVVAAYRRDMESGRWDEGTGEPIQISQTGGLMNGQHRMTSLAGSSCTGVEFLVVRGLEDVSQTMMDQGAQRGVADALKISQGTVKNVAIVASLTRWMVAHPDPGVPGMLTNLKRKVSAAEAVEVYLANPDIQEAADRAVGLRRAIPASQSAIAYAWLHMHRADPEACNEFFGAIADLSFGVNNDPRKAALRALTDLTTHSESRGDKGTSVAVISVLTRAWNAWRKGEELATIRGRNSKGQPLDPVQPI